MSTHLVEKRMDTERRDERLEVCSRAAASTSSCSFDTFTLRSSSIAFACIRSYAYGKFSHTPINSVRCSP